MRRATVRVALFALLMMALFALTSLPKTQPAPHFGADGAPSSGRTIVWHVKRFFGVAAHVPKRSTLTFIHIPKTAGISFAKDGRKVLPETLRLVQNHEASVLATQGPRGAMVVFLREPRRHVLSQFTMCKYNPWGQRQTNHTTFPRDDMANATAGFGEWVRHFTSAGGGEARAPDYDPWSDYDCYNPWNMQTRYMTTSAHPHHLTDASEREPNVTRAMRVLDEFFFVGITEFYELSLCAFEYAVSGATKCECAADHHLRVNVRKETQELHSIPPHSIEDVDQRTRLLVDDLTRRDRELYDHALSRFWTMIRKVEKHAGVKLQCG